MIFGVLLTSSNYDDSQKKVTGGRNGFGAKLCNVYSTEFTVETQDMSQKKKYKQTWRDNMGKRGEPKITPATKGEDYTKVTFKPDYARFGMHGMDDDFEALVKRRVYDLAGTVKVAVKLNGSRIPVRNFKKYMEMYTKAIRKERGEEGASSKEEIITCSPDPHWEIGFAVSDGSFHQVSFVNAIATTSGGTHVNYIADQICNKLADQVKRKNKNGATLKAAQIKNHIFVFVNALIVNPSFNSQTKEQLSTKSSQFGSKCILDDDFYKKILKTDVLSNILHFAQRKADQMLTRNDGGRRTRMNNPKLTDANKAGTRDGHHCTLILTEGDSAKGLAMAGRAVVGPDLFGVFPLRGKLLNVRDASFDQISKNQEIQNIKNFIGLQHKKEYTDTRGLRYGHLMIMTDQDHDGSHIKGLLINFLQAQFPSLLRIPEFLIEFITPIVKVWKGDPKKPSRSQAFFTMPEYEAWQEAHKNERGWEHKYYKGLGTSTTEDAEIYFRDLDRHLKEFHTMQDHEAGLIDLAFSKKKADDRKEWLRQFKPGTYLDHAVDKITYSDFVNKELILFSVADNMRSIPSVVDGLKPGQRKVLFTAFRRNLRKDMKVIELAGYVSGMTAYQHGEGSLHQTIIGLAQNYVGSNNVNCLEPSGNFGSRLQGGADCASPRYIYTRLSPFARRVFHTADEPLLTHNEDDGMKIEPELYIPVVPMILVNGAEGIGTGWSTNIPNYNPEEIVENLKRLMDGEPVQPMQPWFRGFNGSVTQLGADRYKFSGIIRESGDKELEITELPIRTWTQDFKDKLEDIIKGEKVPSFIKDYKDYNTHTKVHFVIQLDDKNSKGIMEENLDDRFKLSKTVATSNLVAFDAEGRICKYSSVDDILRDFYAIRIKFYEKRKQHQLMTMQNELEKLSNQARFVQMIIDGSMVISKKKKSVLIQELKDKAFKPFPKVSDAAKAGETEKVVDEEDGTEEEDLDTFSNGYDYLLGMSLWSLTQERVERLRRQIGDKEMEIDALIKLSKEDIWKHDLDEFLEEWRVQINEEAQRRRKVATMGRRTSNKLMTAGGRGRGGGKKRKADMDDDDEDFAVATSRKKMVGGGKKKADAAPTGTLHDFLSKPKPSVKAEEDDNLSDFEPEVLPSKSRGMPKPAPTVKLNDDDDEDVFLAAGVESKKPTASSVSARLQQPPKPKPAQITELSDSDSDNGDDLLGDVGKMVKGIGGAGSNSRELFSERSRPNGKTTMSKAANTTKASTPKLSSDLDDDDTDYSKLVPVNSPRRSIHVKPKDHNKTVSDERDRVDVEMIDLEDEEEAQPKKAANGKAKAAATKAKPAVAPKTSTKARGKNAKPADKPASSTGLKKPMPLSPAAKAYAAKIKAGRKKTPAEEDGSDDDIDAMANDILDSNGEDPDEQMKSPAPRGRAASRPARQAASQKKSYKIEALSESGDDDEEEDTYDDFDESY